MKDILVHVDESDAGLARVQSAVDLAQAFGARLTGLHVRPDVDISPGVPLAQMGAIVQLAEETLASDARNSRTMFLASVAAGQDHDWRAANGDVAHHVAEEARYADLVVLGQYEREGSAVHHPLPACHAVGVRCGRPVLVVPGVTEKLGPLLRVVIAWDGSREAVRAVHDAIPFLQRAIEVEVVVAKPQAEHLTTDVQQPRRLSDHLARHGVEITTWKRIENGGSVAAAIYAHIDQHRFDLLVMGAYTHPAWYEFLAGGVTKSLLLTCPIPMLISH